MKKKLVGRWLGVASSVGPIMTFWILPSSSVPIPRSTVIPLLPNEYDDTVIKDRMAAFTVAISKKMEAISSQPNPPLSPSLPHQLIDVKNPGHCISKTHTSQDLRDGDVEFLPCEPTSDDKTMEQLDEHIGQ